MPFEHSFSSLHTSQNLISPITLIRWLKAVCTLLSYMLIDMSQGQSCSVLANLIFPKKRIFAESRCLCFFQKSFYLSLGYFPMLHYCYLLSIISMPEQQIHIKKVVVFGTFYSLQGWKFPGKQAQCTHNPYLTILITLHPT